MCLKILYFFTFYICCSCSNDFYAFSVNDHMGNDVSLEKYRGKVSLVVNVASQCAFTDAMYRSLTKLQDILGYGGFFNVLAFPCNQFGEQEPEDASDIYEKMLHTYGIEFSLFNKIDVTGENASQAFRNLIEQTSIVPEWNFFKYLVNHDGKVLNAWGTRTTIEEIFDEIQAAVENAKSQTKKVEESVETETSTDMPDEKDEL